jgi:hypothetical protein
MPPITGPLKLGDTGAIVHALHQQLMTLAFPLDGSEFNSQKFDNTTLAAVLALRARYGLPAVGNNAAPFDAPVGRLLYAASAAVTGNNHTLRHAVRESFAGAQSPPHAGIGWLATHAAIARDFTTARQAAALEPLDAQIWKVLRVVRDSTVQPAEPEMQNPENYYTCRYDYVPQAVLDDLLGGTAGSAGPRSRLRLARRRPARQDEDDDWPDVPDSVPDPEPPPPPPTDDPRRAEISDAAISWANAVDLWQRGNREFKRQRYANAVTAYNACQDSVIRYFAKFHKFANVFGHSDITMIIGRLVRDQSVRPKLWERINSRRVCLSVPELQQLDWGGFSAKAEALLRKNISGTAPNQEDNDDEKLTRQQSLDYFALLLTTIFVPFARAEANRLRRFSGSAIEDLQRVLMPYHVLFGTTAFAQEADIWLTCDFIERPFGRLALGETLLDEAEAEYKSEAPAGPDAPQEVVDRFHGMKAAQTYLQVLDLYANEGAYVARVQDGRDHLAAAVNDQVAIGNGTDSAFSLLGKDVTVKGIVRTTDELPGLARRKAPARSWLRIADTVDGEAVSEMNPRVYALLLTAQARLEQLANDFNYLGYRDDYVPPWRFQFLLDRARYFAEHAKNAQREYLNFLSNAEHEEFQELSASQNVEMEKSNVRIESARVDQADKEVAAATASQVLATLSASDAAARLAAYRDFDAHVDVISGTGIVGQMIGQAAFGGRGANFEPLGEVVTGAIDFVTGGFASKAIDRRIASLQREYERINLELAAQEAAQAANVAQSQLDVANSAFIVAGLQRQAALLRHEFAIQNLEFLRGRVLNAEQWYRLVAGIRSVSETYLRYAVELAFLAEQAYEFEADKRINVIRFDYDLSEVGGFLAGDFLLRDLDTLEQDLIVTQRQRQEQVRYVLSMAREFPEALQEIRERGQTTFSLRLEQIEKRFPGLYNVRIGAVDVLPVALMDSSRFSLELSHLGTSQVRLKAQPDTPPGIPSTSPLNTNDLPVPAGGWLAELQETWPVKLRVTGPEAAVFSGLSRQEANAVFAFATTGQRHAFEALGVAAAWQVNFTARENQVVPGTLADLLVTFTLSGYYDPELRSAVDRAPRTARAVTRWLSGQTTFPDALYEFNRSGRMAWNVTRDLLTLTDTLGAVRNVAVLLLPTPGRTNYFGRVMSHCEVQVRITATGNLQVLSEIPQVILKPAGAATPLTLTARATLPPGAQISWDFGDGSPRQSGAAQQHSYARPGRYTVSLRVVRNGRLSEFRAEVVVSRSLTNRLRPPVTVIPQLTRETGTDIPAGHTRVVGTVNAPAGDPVIATWRVGEQGSVKGNRVTFDWKPGDYTLFFTAVRTLKARVYCTQRQLTGPGFDFNGLSLASNRRFDPNGTETTGVGDNPPANPVATHLFGSGAISPVDEWTVELPLADNACLRSVGATDVEQYDLSEIQDAVLALEYETTPASSTAPGLIATPVRGQRPAALARSDSGASASPARSRSARAAGRRERPALARPRA